MTAPVLVGSNLALLVGAAELVRRGRRVMLATDGRDPGGHFTGVTLAGEPFDIGRVLMERHVPASPATALDTYDPDRLYDWARFGHLAGAWLERQVELVQAAPQSCLLDGAVCPDFLMTNRLDAFARLDVEGPAPLAHEDPRYAARKGEPGAFDHLTYAEAAACNHGSALHARCIEPFVRKVTGGPSQALLARHHRAVWAPLYYPGTVRDALAGRPVGLTAYPYWATAQGFTGELVHRLRRTLAQSPLATVVSGRVEGVRRDGAGWTVAVDGVPPQRTERLGIGVPVARAHGLFGLPVPDPLPAASVSLLFALVRADAIGRGEACLLVVDEGFATYRINDQDALAGRSSPWHRVTVEANPALLARLHPGVEPGAAMHRELDALLQLRGPDAARPLRAFTAHRTLAVPSATSVAAGAAAREALRGAAPGALLTGALLGQGVSSLNDQIVQGLALAEQLA